MKNYKLVHVTANGEFMTPLVASQLFDQAQEQITHKSNNSPKSVSVWIFEPMRSLVEKKAKNKLAELKKRCPNINISLIAGVNRLNDFPAIIIMIIKRLLMGPTPVIFHCRGTVAQERIAPLKRFFSKDKIVLDIRGYWPAEALYINGITEPELALSEDKVTYLQLKNKVTEAIGTSDAVCSISNELITLLKDNHNLVKPSWVVPCCLKNIPEVAKLRNEKRKELGFNNDDIVIVYSGTTAKYQHLEDMCLPLMKSLSESNKRFKLFFLTPDLDKMTKMISDAAITDYKILTVTQDKVAAYLSAADYGLLLRKPTLVNKVANPVKIGEYLSTGLGIIIQNGCVSTGISKSNNSFIEVNLLDESVYNSEVELLANKILNQSRELLYQESISLCKENYLWQNTINVHRASYSSIL